MVVTRARGWITLLVTGVVIGVALVWGFFGVISKTVKGQGVLLPALNPVVLYAQGTARVLSIGVAEGDKVEAGQVLMTLGNPPLEKSLVSARETLKTLRGIDERMTSGEKAKLQIAQKELRKKQSALQRTIKDTDRLCQLQKQQLEAEAKLLEEGLIPKQQWIQSQRTLAQLVEQKFNSESQLPQALLDFEQVQLSIQQARDERAVEIARAESDLAEIEAHSQTELKVTSPIDGHVLELRAGAYSEVSAGSELLEILPLGEAANRCVAYVNASHGKKVEEGMRVLVSPSIAAPERYGYIVGYVSEVSEMISSKAEIVRVFENEQYASSILTAYPAPLRIVVAMQPDARTLSGFQWTSSAGLPGKIGIGTICSVEAEVQQDRPIELLIPWLKKSVGMYD